LHDLADELAVRVAAVAMSMGVVVSIHAEIVEQSGPAPTKDPAESAIVPGPVSGETTTPH